MPIPAMQMLQASKVAGGGGGPVLPSGPEATWQITNTSGISAGSWAHTVGANVGIGRLLVVNITTQGPTTSTYNVTDSQGNTYTETSGVSNGSTGLFETMAYTVVANALTTSDTITITPSSGTITRVLADAMSFDWSFSSVVQGAWNPLSSASQVSGSQNVGGRAVLVGAHVLLNSGRTTTVSSPWTGLTKGITAAGSTERAHQSAWRIIDPSATGVTYPVGYNSTGSGTTSFLAFVE